MHAVLLVIASAWAASCVHGGPQANDWTHYRGAILAFDHPTAWKERPQTFYSGSFAWTYALFSTRLPDHTLCWHRQLPQSGTIQEGCDPGRLGKLGPGDAVLLFGGYGSPVTRGLPAGEPLAIDGHDARLNHDDRSGCVDYMGGDGAITITITISPSDSHNFLEFDACGLKVADLEQQMRRIAESTKFVAPT